MRKKNNFNSLNEPSLLKRMVPVFIVLIVVAVLAIYLMFNYKNDKKNKVTNENVTENSSKADIKEDPDNPDDPEDEMANNIETGSSVDFVSILSTEDETDDITYGIDVSKYQGTIDWKKVAASGIDFAMIRVGYRTQIDGTIHEDSNAKYNLQEAIANGIKVGVYFFSTAISTSEAIEEANWVDNFISPYQITYPVAYDSEGFDSLDSRQNSLSVTERTTIAKAFMDAIYSKDYTPMFYSASNELENDSKWLTSNLQNSYKIWVAQYPDTSSDASTYSGTHAMWQYTNRGNVSGISTTVDIDIAYFGYNNTANAQGETPAETVSAETPAAEGTGDGLHTVFTECNDSVTAKIEVNLRALPSVTNPDATVVAVLKNGEVITRTGMNTDYGWSRVEYNGETLYCISSYLTTP